uniref:UBR-type domain-containing protein n=1 Tax=Panagrellus redivivus TaxID=6233 RepID=A0A7E4UME1_PANRE
MAAERVGEKVAEATVDRLLSAAELDDFMNEDAERFAGLNDKVCTYGEGYFRQEVFACLTCSAESGQVAGVCYACSLACHEDHELLELYTKRQFKCDCGNGRFADGNTCKLEPEKATRNEYNKYNDNFSNKWCTCKKPYPPEEDTPEADSEMLQCSVCEDWFHTIHLEGEYDHDVEELICKGCVTKLPFLLAYEDYPEAEKPTDGSCFLTNRKAQMEAEPKAISFAKAKAFREGLCTCLECKKLYTLKDVEFLTDYEDAVAKYNDDRAALAKEDQKKDVTAEISKLVSDQFGHEVANAVVLKLEILRTVMVDEMKKVSDDGGVVTEAVAKRIFERAEEVDADSKRARLDDNIDVNNCDP